ncbi:Crp/Fnr family transcriptional regulator [Aquabacterium sp.]|uniref:Crp/Fnr family transcriptional regulator n=1 Tax=Aquabacterium sp. TaxID=1872578 RepID=UPI003784CF3B
MTILYAPDFPHAEGATLIEPQLAHAAFAPCRAPMQELLTLLGVRVPVDDGSSEPLGWVPLWRVRPGQALVHEGAAVDHIHVVRSGSLKCVRVWEDGYEQVLALAGRGDLIGFESLSRARHLTGAVALEDATVYALAVREVEAMRRRCPSFDRALLLATSRQLAAAGQIAEMLAPVSAETRLARFLVWYAERMAERGESPRRLRLRMPRRDLASLLGVAHETVSRSFSFLAGAGVLRVDNREVEIVDRDGLLACTRSTRTGNAESALRAAQAGRSASTEVAS